MVYPSFSWSATYSVFIILLCFKFGIFSMLCANRLCTMLLIILGAKLTPPNDGRLLLFGGSQWA